MGSEKATDTRSDIKILMKHIILNILVLSLLTSKFIDAHVRRYCNKHVAKDTGHWLLCDPFFDSSRILELVNKCNKTPNAEMCGSCERSLCYVQNKVLSRIFKRYNVDWNNPKPETFDKLRELSDGKNGTVCAGLS